MVGTVGLDLRPLPYEEWNHMLPTYREAVGDFHAGGCVLDRLHRETCVRVRPATPGVFETGVTVHRSSLEASPTWPRLAMQHSAYRSTLISVQ